MKSTGLPILLTEIPHGLPADDFGLWQSCEEPKTRLALLVSTELTAVPGINKPDHAQTVIGAGRFAESFPLLDAFLSRLMVFGFLSVVTRLELILNPNRSAR
jgi:hypothetical protein